MADVKEYGEIGKGIQKKLPELLKIVEKTYTYFKGNYDRFHHYQKFVFETSMTDDDVSILKALNKPQLEFNILNAYVSRLCGEFSKQQPSIAVMPEDGMPVDEEMLKVIEGHLRHILFESSKRSTQNLAYKNSLSGGFSVFKVTTEYANDMSFDQVIKFDTAYEPTLCGFDPMARQPDKSDGEFCFEMFPMNVADFKRLYPKVKLDNVDFVRNIEGFSWTYKSQQDEIIIVCDFYKKKRKRFKIVKLTTGKVVPLDVYQDFLEQWQAGGFIEQPPGIVGEPRWTEATRIERYRFFKKEMLEYVETDYKYLPLVFVDGDSVMIRDGVNGSFQQFTKPYVYHAHGIQRLKNFAGQTLADELENMVQHKFKVAKESLPQEEDYLQAYRNVQQASTLVYNAFMDGDPDKAIPPPQEIARVAPPPEITNTFQISDQVTQNILGSYDAALGINDNQLSGIAIVEAATQSNAASMPYVVNYLHALNQVAQIIVDLIPKYYVTPRTIPVLGLDGEKTYQKINQQGGISFNYDENALLVKVEAGVNFAIQKSRALNQINMMAQASPMFAQFMNDMGLDILIDNMEFRGVDILKQKAKLWMQQMEQMKQQQMEQQANQPNPIQVQAQIEMAKIQQKERQSQIDAQLKAAEIAVNEQKANNDQMKVLTGVAASKDKIVIEHAKAQAEMTRSAVDMAIKAAEVRVRMKERASKKESD